MSEFPLFSFQAGGLAAMPPQALGPLGLAGALWLLARFRRMPGTYDATLAWVRAFAFFWLATALGIATGVTDRLLAPITIPADMTWRGVVALYAVIVIVGYGVIWPRGTLTHGRPLRPIACIFFGLLWGLSQGQVFLSIWAMLESTGFGPWAVAGLTYVAIAVYNALWHSLYWDKHVSPPHNIDAWNGPKIAFTHTPNLLFTLAFLAWFGTPWVVVAMQTLALLLSTWMMHFPRPGDAGAPHPQPA